MASAGDRRRGFDPWVVLGRSPGGGHGYPLQYSCLENPMDRGAWSDMTEAIAHVLVVCHKGARSLRLHINPTLMSAA